jgi:ubiquinol-cytochrome c reductase cytochrome c subunit
MITRRRTRAAVGLALGLTALVLTVRSASGVDAAGAVTAQSEGEVPPGGRQPPPPVAEELDSGRQLFLTACANCHGADGLGTPQGPRLITSGRAKADFYLRTGRMPLAADVPQPPAKLPAFDDHQIRLLVDYVGSLCRPELVTPEDPDPCPDIPVVDLDRARIEAGQELFLANCAGCHNASAVGGALLYGRHAPSLQETPPVQVAEAIRTGPGQMPRFGPDVLDDGQVNSIVSYVNYLHEPETPGGFTLGLTGPVPEGFVALLIGLGALLWAARWITREPAGRHGRAGLVSGAPPKEPGGGEGEP